MPSYRAPSRTAAAELRVKGSRFLALVGAAVSEAEIRATLSEAARCHRDATHHCWAARLGWPPRESWSDAGEPSGTAGKPILLTLRGAAVSDAMAVVVRWFGGVKLGKGGLARAYAAATAAALAELETVLRVPRVCLAVTVPLARLGAVKRLLRPPDLQLESESFDAGVGTGEPAAHLVLSVAEEGERALREVLASLQAIVVGGIP